MMIRQGATGLGTDWARVFPEDLFEGRGEKGRWRGLI